MAKTVKQLEEELRAAKEQLALVKVDDNLEAENEQLKQELQATKAHSKESEARLMAELKQMDETGVTIAGGIVVGTEIKVMTPDEYKEYSRKQGRYMGRPLNQKTKCSIEELRSLINSKWTPKMIMDKHGLDADDFKQLVWKLSKREMRESPIRYDLKLDRFL